MSDTSTDIPATGRQIRSLITAEGELELSLVDVDVPAPTGDQVLVRIEAAPINPSDLGLLFGGADMTAASASGTPDQPVVTATIAPPVLAAMAARVGESMAVGNEGGGVVVATGSSPGVGRGVPVPLPTREHPASRSTASTSRLSPGTRRTVRSPVPAGPAP